MKKKFGNTRTSVNKSILGTLSLIAGGGALGVYLAKRKPSPSGQSGYSPRPLTHEEQLRAFDAKLRQPPPSRPAAAPSAASRPAAAPSAASRPVAAPPTYEQMYGGTGVSSPPSPTGSSAYDAMYGTGTPPPPRPPRAPSIFEAAQRAQQLGLNLDDPNGKINKSILGALALAAGSGALGYFITKMFGSKEFGRAKRILSSRNNFQSNKNYNAGMQNRKESDNISSHRDFDSKMPASETSPEESNETLRLSYGDNLMKEKEFAEQMYKNLGITPREVNEKVSKAQFRGNRLAKSSDARSWSPGVYDETYMTPQNISHPHSQMQIDNEANLAINLAPNINNEDAVNHMAQLLGLSKSEVMRRIGIADFDDNPFSQKTVQEFAKGPEPLRRYIESPDGIDLIRKAEAEEEPASGSMANARRPRMSERREQNGKNRAREDVRASRRAAETERSSVPKKRGPVDFDSPNDESSSELPLGMYEHQGRVREYGRGQLREHDAASNPEDGIGSFLVQDYNRSKRGAGQTPSSSMKTYEADEDSDGSPF